MIYQGLRKKVIVSLMAIPFTCITIAHANSEPLFEIAFDSENPMNKNEFALIPFAGDPLISSIISNNLSSTELQPTTKYTPANIHSSRDILENLSTWQRIGVPYIIIGKTVSNNGSIFVEYEVVDVKHGRVVEGTQSTVTSASQQSRRMTAHKISDNIYKLMTGIKGDFSGRIAYIEEKGSGSNKISSLKVMDSDRKNTRSIYSIQGSIFSPAWSPNGKYIAFSAQGPKNRPVIYIKSVDTNSPAQQLTSQSTGSHMSPSFSPDGSNIVYSTSNNGNADIYQLYLNSGSPRKLISMPSDETEPSYSPDGNSFVFVSNKAGVNSPQIYRYSFYTGGVTQLTSGGYRTSPSFNADGSQIIFLNSATTGTTATMNADGRNIRNIAYSNKTEAARFSGNGTRLVYASTRGGQGIINIRSLNGGDSFKNSANGIIHSPTWSKSVD